MTSLDEVFVADAVSHAYNLHPSNFRIERHAEKLAENIAALESSMPVDYRRTAESVKTDMSAEDAANMLFRESQVDYTVFHPQTISVFHDGLTALDKARAFHEAHPTRTGAMASVDLFGMDDPKAELTRQVEEFDPNGVKVYPSYWEGDSLRDFRMNDAELAFPLWEHAADLGLDVIAVHKSVPLGSVPMDPYRIEDVDEAASSFPDLNFEIVHGGLTFAEEAGTQLAFHPNIYVNLEITAIEAALSPNSFVETMRDLLWMGGKKSIEKIMWGSGVPQFHPQLLLEAFWNFDFPEMEWMGGTYQITEEDKRKMLGENLADAHGLDIDAIQAAQADDEFADRGAPAEPYSTTTFEKVDA